MNDEQNRDAGRPDERPWQDAQSSGQQQGGMAQNRQQAGGQTQDQQSAEKSASQQQNDEMFQGADNASDDLTGGRPSPGYGDRQPGGRGADQIGDTSVTGKGEAQGEEADLSDVDFESDMDNDRS